MFSSLPNLGIVMITESDETMNPLIMCVSAQSCLRTVYGVQAIVLKGRLKVDSIEVQLCELFTTYLLSKLAIVDFDVCKGAVLDAWTLAK